jgi:LysM repeat protein
VTNYVGPDRGPSRMSTVVAVLLAVALMAALLALALGMGVLQFRPPGDGTAVLSPSPTPLLSPTPAEATPDPTVEPTPEVTPEPPSPQPTPDEPGPPATPGGTHIVQPGESLFSIGLLYGVPYLEIAAANNLENPDLLRVGQELIIPVPNSVTPPPGVHVVQSGESITSIAELYDVDPTDLADLNGIENWDLIFVGQQLLIPGLAEPTPSPEP